MFNAKTISISVLGACALSAFVWVGAASAKVTPILAPDGPEPQIDSYILLDRTGSMQGLWEEALGSVNAYVDELAKSDNNGQSITGDVTLASFDYQDGFQFDFIRRDVTPDAWVDISTDELSPRGMTPLYDAIGSIVSHAQSESDGKAVIIIMTDGKENASREVTAANARAALDNAKARGWEVVFLGADFASFSDAEAVGVSGKKSIAISPENLSISQRALANKVKSFAAGKEAEIVFDAQDRAQAGEEDVKTRKGTR